MNDLFTAIYSHFLTDPLAGSLTDLYDTKAPADAIFPYGVFSMPSDKQEFTFEEDFENCLVQFNLYSHQSSAEELGELFELLKGNAALSTGFDFLDLVINNFFTVSMEREMAIRTKIDEEDVWQYSVTYRLVLQRSGEVAHAAISKYLYNLMSL